MMMAEAGRGPLKAESALRAGSSRRAALFWALVFILMSYSRTYPGGRAPNEQSRVYLALALIDDQAISVDGPVRRFGQIADLSSADGRWYTDKAPGSSLAAALVYAGARVFTAVEDWTLPGLVNLMRVSIMFPVGLVGLWLLRRYLARLSLSSSSIDLASAAWILGSAAFHYSTAFYGHQIVAVALLASLVALTETQAPSMRRLAGAGAAAGYAVLTEYQAGPAAVVMAALALFVARRRPLRFAWFVAGAAPFAVLFLAYNKAAFGGWFEFSYQHLAYSEARVFHERGIAGVWLPRRDAVMGSMFSLHRGLFATSPFFILVPWGLVVLWRRGFKAVAASVALVCASYLAMIFSADAWFAGWSFGPRLLVPVMALAAFPVAAAADEARGRRLLAPAIYGLVAWGILYNQAVHLVYPEPPPDAQNPLFDFMIPAVHAGRLSSNLLRAGLGVSGVASAVPAAAATLALLVLLWTGWVTRRGRRDLAAAILVPVLVVSILPVWAAVRGPSWDENIRGKFILWMQHLEGARHNPPSLPGPTP